MKEDRKMDEWGEEMYSTNNFLHLILLGYPEVIQMLLVFKDRIGLLHGNKAVNNILTLCQMK